MIILLLFLAAWFGLILKSNVILSLILLSAVIGFSFWKFSKKFAFTLVFVALLSGGISFVKIDLQKSIYQGMVSEVSDNYFLFVSDFEPLYVYEKNTTREVGDFLSIEGVKEKLNFEVRESQFDFNDYLAKRGVYYALKATKTLSKFVVPIRINAKRKQFLSKFSKEGKDFVSSLLFSKTQSDGIIDEFQNLNLSRLMLASGIYLSFYLRFIEKLLRYKLKEKSAAIFSFLFLLPYFIFVFPKFSVIRVSLLFALKFVNNYALKKRFNYLEIVSIAGLTLLVLNPNFAKQMSFILSFGVTIFVYFFQNSFAFLSKFKKKIFLIVSIHLFLVPFSFYSSSSIYLFETLGQLIFFPILSIFAIISLFCFYQIPLYSLVNDLSVLTKNIFRFLGKFSLQIHGPPMNLLAVFVFEILLFVLLYFASLRIRKFRNVSAVVFLTFLTFYSLPIKNTFSCEVSFINVGQGDSILIRSQNEAAIIDTGGSLYIDIARECLVPYFKSQRIYHLNYVITTHDDYDHSGALPSLMENFKVDNYVNTFESFPLKLGDITLHSLNDKDFVSEDENDKSLIIKFEIQNTKFLLMGDASKTVEANLLKRNVDLDCDILKVSHHGSKTATSQQFLDATTPSEAIISTGRNTYGHPHREVIQLLNKNDIKIRRTDLEGTISYFFKKSIIST